MSTSAHSTSTLTDLFPELRRMVLEHLTPADILSMASASGLYRGDITHQQRMDALLEAALSPIVLEAATALLNTSKSTLLAARSTTERESRHAQLLANVVNALEGLSLPLSRTQAETSLIADFYVTRVRPLITEIRQHSTKSLCDKLPPDQGSGDARESFNHALTSQEEDRFARALYQYQVCCNLIEATDCVLEAPPLAIAARYLARFDVRAINAVLSIISFVQDRYVEWTKAVRIVPCERSRRKLQRAFCMLNIDVDHDESPGLVAHLMTAKGISTFSDLLYEPDLTERSRRLVNAIDPEGPKLVLEDFCTVFQTLAVFHLPIPDRNAKIDVKDARERSIGLDFLSHMQTDRYNTAKGARYGFAFWDKERFDSVGDLYGFVRSCKY
ncbi:hypothetical protein KVT40_004077 [Elsinoe batatas]|uniref:Uncharacterized protein n=1 Tax=Elsinoe batatas TaxID=2601811 RepID=A0A8K0L1Z9_9PEZI|nr:hypothetical protein KVT40_004077 [Elsinoe batatas]